MARRKLLNFLTWGAKQSVSAPSVEEVGGSFELARCHVLVVKIVIYSSSNFGFCNILTYMYPTDFFPQP